MNLKEEFQAINRHNMRKKHTIAPLKFLMAFQKYQSKNPLCFLRAILCALRGENWNLTTKGSKSMIPIHC